MVLVAYATGAIMGMFIGFVIAIRKNLDQPSNHIKSHRRTRAPGFFDSAPGSVAHVPSRGRYSSVRVEVSSRNVADE
jgi:hypothetical protein